MSARRKRPAPRPPASPPSGGPPGPRRRAVTVGLAAVAILLVLAAAVVFLRRPAPFAVERTADQNILLVTIDTLRADALGSYGGAARTPHLDALADEGIRFDFAHAHAVVTLPSHASILTGVYPFQHGIRENGGYRLPPDATTLAGLLKQQGYATGAFVGAFPVDAQFGLNTGFDRYDDDFGVAGGSVEFSIAERPAQEVVAAARAWMDAQEGRWFAWVHVFDPHAPYSPPAPFDQQYRARPYDGEVAYTDSALGPLFEAARAGSDRPTLVVVTADHGEALGDHGEMTHGLFAYEPTLRVPLILSQLAPRSAPRPVRRAGHVSSIAARHVDIAPTILDAAWIEPPPGLAGRTLLGPGGAAADPDDRTSYFEAMSASLNSGWAPLQGVLLGREKYIELPLPELYDLGEDAAEEKNLIDSRAERVRLLQRMLAGFAAPPPGGRVAESAETIARLRALGYVSGEAAPKDRYTEADDPKRLIALDRMVHEGVELFERGRHREAIEKYRTVIERRPDMAIAYRHLAYVYWQMGDAGAAIGTLKAAMASGIVDALTQTRLGTYLAEAGAPAEAIALLEGLAAAEAIPGADTLNGLGIAYARAGRTEEALATFRRLLRDDPANIMALENIGTVHLQRGELAEARTAFERAVRLAPTAARAHSGLGVVYLQAGDRDAAIASWTRAVDLNPGDFDALFNLGTELVNAGRPEAARPYLERFVRTAPPAFYAADIRRISGFLDRR